MFRSPLLIILFTVNPILASEERPEFGPITALGEVRNCAGLATIDKIDAGILAFSDSHIKSCPRLVDHFKSLKPQEQCLSREMAVFKNHTRPTTWERLGSGSGCYKWPDTNRKDSGALISECHKNPAIAMALARSYCEKE